jgi:hypothetical protein
MPEIKKISSKHSWNDIFTHEFEGYCDIYFTFNYFDLFQRHFKVKAEALYWNDDHITIFWPHLVRKTEPMTDDDDHDDLYDLVSPYGYAGPLVLGKDVVEGGMRSRIGCFLDEYEALAQTKRYVCEFIRFHPIFRNVRYFKHNMVTECVTEVVLIDLNKTLATIWKDIRKGHRYDISKCEKRGCQTSITCQPSVSEVRQFADMYALTMDRVKAEKKYYFPFEFIADHFKLLNTLLISVKKNDEIIAGGMFLLGHKYIHYHLAATSLGSAPLAPSKLVLWTAIRWAQAHGLRCFNLGGGFARLDELGRFKRGFSKNRAVFHVGKKVFDEKMYERLVSDTMPFVDDKRFFPAYRRRIDDTIV